MTKGEYIKYAIQKTVSEYSFLEWLEMWDIEEEDWNKFMSEGSKAVSQEESGEEQEPCGKDINVPATDAISRQVAIDALGECPMVWTDSDAEITAERDWQDTVEMLRSLPSVTPQPKTEVLDKIRAEVKALPNANPSYSGYIDVVDREDVLEIIDKYKEESEEKYQ